MSVVVMVLIFHSYYLHTECLHKSLPDIKMSYDPHAAIQVSKEDPEAVKTIGWAVQGTPINGKVHLAGQPMEYSMFCGI